MQQQNQQPKSIQAQQHQKLAKKIKNFIYNPHDMIGSGFSSQVFKGIDQNTLQPIAIKVIELAKIQNEVQKYLLNNQITALRTVNHKNILHIVDILMTKNNVYIVTEFCEDGDLHKKIQKAKKAREKQPKQNQLPTVFPQWDALSIIRDILEGYKSLEDKKILHRDLKTANIFLSKGNAKIADFGFCQVQSQNSKKPQIAYNVGSPAYMSPQSYKDNHYSHKSDLWSIGIILYEMLRGQTPDKTQTYETMAKNLCQGRINCGPNQQIKNILTKCFKRNLKERFDIRGMLDAVNAQIRKLQSKMTITGSVIINKTNGTPNVGNPVRHSQFIPANQPNPFIHQPTNFQNQSQKTSHFPEKVWPEDQKTQINRNNKNNNEDFKKKNLQSNRQINYSNLITNLPGSVKNDNLQKSNSENNQNLHKNNHIQIQSSQQQNQPFFSHQRKRSKSPEGLSEEASNSQKTAVINNEAILVQNKSSVMKGSIDILLFLYRLLKFVSETPIVEAQMTRLILFRHRSLIDQAVSLMQNNDENYRQFQYLKSRFDQVYIQKEFNHNPQHKTITTLNQLTNSQFKSRQVIRIYQQIFNQACQSCENYIYGTGKVEESTIDFNKVGIMWDYLMLQIQVLSLLGQGRNTEQISQTMNLSLTIKEHPKKLLNTHYELLKLKNRAISSNLNRLLNSERSVRKSFGYQNQPLFRQPSAQFINPNVNGDFASVEAFRNQFHNQGSYRPKDDVPPAGFRPISNH